MSTGTNCRDALGLGVRVLQGVCDERSPVVRLRDRHALHRLLARSASSVSWSWITTNAFNNGYKWLCSVHGYLNTISDVTCSLVLHMRTTETHTANIAYACAIGITSSMFACCLSDAGSWLSTVGQGKAMKRYPSGSSHCGSSEILQTLLEHSYLNNWLQRYVHMLLQGLA